MSLNKVMLIGRLGRDPEVRNTQSGAVVCTLALATDESYVDGSGQKVEKTEWHRIVAFSKLADVCQRFLHKGSLCYVEGQISSRKYTDQQGVERTTTEVKAHRVEFLDPKGSNGSGGQGGYQQDTPRQDYQNRGNGGGNFRQGQGSGGSGFVGRPSESDEIPF